MAGWFWWVKFSRYLAPLALLTMTIDISDILLNTGITLGTSPNASATLASNTTQQATTLAAFGASHRVVRLFFSLPWEMRAVGLRLVDSSRLYWLALLFAVIISSACSVLLVFIALTPARYYLTGFTESEAVSYVVRDALTSMSVLPVLKGIDRFHEGILLRKKLSSWVSFSGLLDLFVQMLSLSIVPVVLSGSNHAPLFVPIVAIYMGQVCKLGVVIYAVSRHGPAIGHSYRQLTSREYLEDIKDEEHSSMGICWIFRHSLIPFWAPLASVRTFQAVSRPIINVLVAISPSGLHGVAVLTLCFPFGHISYSWLNDLKGLGAAFLRDDGSLPHLKRFIPSMVAVAFASSFAFLWLPGALYVLRLMQVQEVLVNGCILPFRIFSFFCFAVGTRNYYTALCIVAKRTWPLTFSGPIRFIAIVTVGITLRTLNVTGAFLGIVTLFSGFIAEATAVVICYHNCNSAQRQDKREQKVQLTQI